MWEGLKIIETGWRADGFFIVVLGGEKRSLLESEKAHEYARVIAERRRCKTSVTAEPAIASEGRPPFRRTYCFSE